MEPTCVTCLGRCILTHWTTREVQPLHLQCAVLCLVVSCIQLFVTPWTVTTRRAPLSMGLSRQEYCSGLPCPPPGDLPHPGIQPRSPTLQADSLPGKPLCIQQCDSFKLLCSNFSPLGFCDTVLFLMFLIILCSSWVSIRTSLTSLYSLNVVSQNLPLTHCSCSTPVSPNMVPAQAESASNGNLLEM